MRRVSRAVYVLAAGLAAPSAIHAASFAIDPDPRSPTLGELLDRESGRRAPLPAKPPVSTNAARAGTSEPIIPQGAVTVLAPGVRHRIGGTRALPKRP